MPVNEGDYNINTENQLPDTCGAIYFQRIKFQSMPMQLNLTYLLVIGSQDGMLPFPVDKYLMTIERILWE